MYEKQKSEGGSCTKDEVAINFTSDVYCRMDPEHYVRPYHYGLNIERLDFIPSKGHSHHYFLKNTDHISSRIEDLNIQEELIKNNTSLDCREDVVCFVNKLRPLYRERTFYKDCLDYEVIHKHNSKLDMTSFSSDHDLSIGLNSLEDNYDRFISEDGTVNDSSPTVEDISSVTDFVDS